ncbi:MAG: hypothetical protein ACJ8HI_16865 [Massilia sp.]
MQRLAALLAFSFTAMAAHAASAATSDPAPQGSAHMSNASNAIANGSARVVGGALESVAGAGSLVVASVETVGDGSVVILKAAGKASTATVAFSGRAARDASLVVGASVEMVALSTGYLLVTAGRVIAFVPNEMGKALLHSSRIERPAFNAPASAPQG